MPSDFEVLSNAFAYDPESGNLYWKIRQGQMSPGKKAGFPAAEPGIDGTKYQYVRLNQRNYSVHRVAWLLMTGSFPEKGMEVDHINRKRDDNRWSNLRVVTKAQNMRNRSTNKNNSTGVRGVSMDRGKFRVRIQVDGKSKSMGLYSSLADAEFARKMAEKSHFKEYARVY